MSDCWNLFYVAFLSLIISVQYNSGVQQMNRGSAFMLSANMALGRGAEYDYSKPSANQVKLAKKKNHPKQIHNQHINHYYNEDSFIPSTKNIGTFPNDFSYEAFLKNYLTRNQKQIGENYGSKQLNKQYSDFKTHNSNIKKIYTQNDQYSYSNKVQQNIEKRYRNARTVQYTHNYEELLNYSKKNEGGKFRNYNNIQTEPSYVTKESKLMLRNPHGKQYNQALRREQPRYINEREEKSIRELNRQKRMDVIEYHPSDLRACRNCGRKFNPDSITKHENNCKKVFQKKRKVFNAQQHRIVDGQQKKLMKIGQKAQKKMEALQKKQKIPKWKVESMAFRAVLKQNRKQKVDHREMALIEQARYDTRVSCPYCGRKFNETAGARHIKFCEEQARKNQIRRKK